MGSLESEQGAMWAHRGPRPAMGATGSSVGKRLELGKRKGIEHVLNTALAKVLLQLGEVSLPHGHDGGDGGVGGRGRRGRGARA